MTIPCILFWLFVPIAVLLGLLWWLDATPQQRRARQAQYLQRHGVSQRAIAAQLGISRAQVRRDLQVAFC